MVGVSRRGETEREAGEISHITYLASIDRQDKETCVVTCYDGSVYDISNTVLLFIAQKTVILTDSVFYPIHVSLQLSIMSV